MRPQPDMIDVELATDEEGKMAWQMGEARNVPAHVKTLKVIRDEEPRTQQALADLLGVKPPAVSRQVKAARESGLLRAVSISMPKTLRRSPRKTQPASRQSCTLWRLGQLAK